MSSVVRAARASPSAEAVTASSASSSMRASRSARPLAQMPARSASLSGRRRHSVERLISAALTSKYGFSVVAPMRTMTPVSVAGSRRSCWALLKRWTSSMKSTVRWPRSPRRSRARWIASRTSLTPEETAESDSLA